MQNKKFFHPSVKTWALAISSSAVLIACGGGSDSDTTSPTPEPEETKTAAHCFDDTLNFTPGNSFDIELNLYNNVEGTIKISRNVQIEGNATHYPTGRVDSAINGLIARTENNTVTAPADITTSYTRINTQFIRPISPDNEIINVGEFQRYFAPNVIRTSNSYSIYNPEYIDQRKELKQNESQTVSFSETITAVILTFFTTDTFNRSYTISYLGDEQISVGNQNLNACRFKKINADLTEETEWIYRGISIRKESNGVRTEEVTSLSIPL